MSRTKSFKLNSIYGLPGSRLCLLVMWLLLASACQSREIYYQSTSASDCHQFLSRLNRDIRDAGVADAQYTTLPGYTHIRVDRFLASLLPELKQAAQFHSWLDQAGALALDGFAVELKNLAPESFQGKYLEAGRCVRLLLAQDKKSLLPDLALRSQAVVEDDYATWQRALGLYPLVILPVAWGINSHNADLQAIYNRENQLQTMSIPAVPVTKIYRPPPVSHLTQNQLAGMIQAASNNPLAIPMFSPREQQLLLNQFAPVWVVSAKGSADQIGTITWSSDGTRPVAHPDKATVYTKISYTRYRKKPLLQLNYIIWFPERPLSSMFDLLGGHLDGITWRITLDSNGQVLMQDSIHNCGCYHMFYPGAKLQAKPVPDSLEEIAFTPQKSPGLEKGNHYNVHVAHSTHYVTGLTSESTQAMEVSPSGIQYEMVSYKNLRNLPHPKLGYRSMFNDQGLVPDSHRGERYLFWPLGIASAGAMRQWGRHATAFIGRRHFDDPDLIEKNFRSHDH